MAVDVIRHWTFEPPVVVGLAVVAALYVTACRAVRRRHGAAAVPRRREVAFLTGLAVCAVALVSPLDYWSDLKFSVHMVQHQLLMMVAAPLLLLGAPVTLALRVVPARTARRLLVPVLHSRAVSTLSSPVVAYTVFVVYLWAAHLSPLYAAALRSDNIHALEHLAFLVTALLFWWPVLAVDPNPRPLSHPARLLYLFLVMPASALLGLAVTSTGRILYPYYAQVGPAIGVNALADQRLAGALMWEGDMLVIVVVMALVLLDWLDSDERSTIRAEARVLAP